MYVTLNEHYCELTMKIIAISDTHFPFDKLQLNLQSGDVLIHAGDFLSRGTSNEWDECIKSFDNLSNFRYKFFVPGNHDMFYQYYTGACMQDMRKRGVYCLTGPDKRHTEFEVNETKYTIGGLPCITGLPNWAYNMTEDQIKNIIFNEIGYVDIFVSHSPPYGLLAGDRANHWGSIALLEYVNYFKPKVVICGHVHESHGNIKYNNTMIYNVAICDLRYEQNNPITVIEL